MPSLTNLTCAVAGDRRFGQSFLIGPVRIDPPLLQAPMAGFTNYPFRQLVRQLGGAGLLATEMIHARGFLWLEDHAAEPERLWGVRDEPRPLAVQIWDNQPQQLAEVGKRLVEQYGVSVVDINFGCPVKKVTEHAHSGSYLLSQPARVGEIVERVAHACGHVPVTAKIRLGCTLDQCNANEIARVVESAGAAALTVHGRTAQQMFRGRADWDRIAEVKSCLNSIPLIGNGDLTSPAQIVEAFRRYGVDGVMIARAALRRPWLFQQAQAALAGQPIPPDPNGEQQRALLLDHYRQVLARFGANKGTQLMRKFACVYAQAQPGARLFRTHIAHVQSPDEFFAVVDRYFPGGRRGEERGLHFLR